MNMSNGEPLTRARRDELYYLCKLTLEKLTHSHQCRASLPALGLKGCFLKRCSCLSLCRSIAEKLSISQLREDERIPFLLSPVCAERLHLKRVN